MKQLELLKEMVPRAKRMAILSSWDSATKEKDFRDSQAAADRLGIKLRFLEARAADDIDRLIKAATEKNTRVDAIHVYGYSWLYLHRKRIMAQAKTRRLPMMYFYPGIVEEGGLMAFGPDMNDQYRQMARLVDRILKGARPSDLPVAEPAKYILAINLRTASELGLTVPQTLLQRADRVIE